MKRISSVIGFVLGVVVSASCLTIATQDLSVNPPDVGLGKVSPTTAAYTSISGAASSWGAGDSVSLPPLMLSVLEGAPGGSGSENALFSEALRRLGVLENSNPDAAQRYSVNVVVTNSAPDNQIVGVVPDSGSSLTYLLISMLIVGMAFLRKNLVKFFRTAS